MPQLKLKVCGRRYDSSDEPHASSILAGHDAEAVMLDFVQPVRAGRRGLCWRRQARLDNAQPGTGTLTQRHGGLIGTSAARVESVGPGWHMGRVDESRGHRHG